MAWLISMTIATSTVFSLGFFVAACILMGPDGRHVPVFMFSHLFHVLFGVASASQSSINSRKLLIQTRNYVTQGAASI